MDSLLKKYIAIIEEVADSVSGKTPEEAMKDPRYISDPAFKAEVDAAASIGTQPPAAPAAADPNYDTMPFGQAFDAAREAGAKDFMWKGKKYAVQMSPKTVQTATSKPTPLPSKTPYPGAGQISDNPAAKGRNTGIMKELNAMRRIAGLKDSGT